MFKVFFCVCWRQVLPKLFIELQVSGSVTEWQQFLLHVCQRCANMKRKRGDKEARTHKKKRRSEKEDGDSAADGLKLLKYAALGEAHKVEKLAKRRRSDIDAIDADGSTALHQVPACHLQVYKYLLPSVFVNNMSLTTVLSQASRHGHLQVVEVLLRCEVILDLLRQHSVSHILTSAADCAPRRHGADARAEDLRGNSPAHFAAAKGHLAVLTALLQVLASAFDKGAAGSFAVLLQSCAESVFAGQRWSARVCRAAVVRTHNKTVWIRIPQAASGTQSWLALLPVKQLTALRLSTVCTARQAVPTPNVDARNADGVSVRDLTGAALEADDVQTW